MKRIDKRKMGEAYVEMGSINLEICEDFFHLETEGDKYNERGNLEKPS